MALAAIRLPLFTQNDCSLEYHTRVLEYQFLELAYQSYFHDSALISSYYAGLNEQSNKKIPLSVYGPREFLLR